MSRLRRPAGEQLFTLNFLLLWAANFTTFASFHLLLPILPTYVLSLGGTASQVGLINGLFTISSVLIRPLAGREVDRRRKKLVLWWGLLAFVFFMFTYNLAYTVALLLLVRLFHGVAWAVTNTSASALLADLAPATRRGEAMGYYGMASSLALAVGPLMGVALLSAYGFPQVFLAASGVALVTLAIVSRLREASPGPQGPTSPGGPPAPAGPLRRSLVYQPALFPALTVLTVTLTYGSVVSFIPLLAFRSNVNPGIFFTVYAIFLILGRPVGGKLADLTGRGAAIIPGIAALALGLGVLAFASDLPHFLAAAALYGIGFSFIHPALMALTVDRAAPEARGAAMATFSAAFDLGIGLGSIFLGLLLEKTSFEVLYLTSAGIAIVSLVGYIIGSRRS